eukprot:6187811-Pleurochrysis_carterae.AAC.1
MARFTRRKLGSKRRCQRQRQRARSEGQTKKGGKSMKTRQGRKVKMQCPSETTPTTYPTKIAGGGTGIFRIVNEAATQGKSMYLHAQRSPFAFHPGCPRNFSTPPPPYPHP